MLAGQCLLKLNCHSNYAQMEYFDGSSPEMVLSSLQAFTEERLKRMSDEEPTLLKSLQAKTIDALHVSGNKDYEESQQVAMESTVTAQLMRNADQEMQQRFNAKLRAFLDPTSPQFAGNSSSV